MKRLVLFAAIGFASLTGVAYAADCGTVSVPVLNSVSISFDSLSASPGSDASCTQPTIGALALPSGYYGVYRVQIQTYSEQIDGDDTTFTVTANGNSQLAEIVDSNADAKYFTKYYAMGTTGTLGFDGDFAIHMTGDGGSFAEIDAADILMAYTSLASQEDSFTQVAGEALGVSTHLDALAGLLTGANQPLEAEDSFSVFGGAGSAVAGASARYNLAEGFSLLGGASIVTFSAAGGGTSGLLAAGALRFVQPGQSDVKLMGEAGAQAGWLNLSFARHYDDGSATGLDVTALGTSPFGAAYLKGGVLWSPDANNDVLFSGILRQSAMSLSDVAEPNLDDVVGGVPNLFSASLTGNETTTLAKAGVDWTTRFAKGVDLTASAAVGAAIGSAVSGDVFGVGTVSGAPQSTVFAQYGLRLGWDLDAGQRLDGFVSGSTGTGIGTHVLVGAAYQKAL